MTDALPPPKPSFLEDSYKLARTTYRVMLGLCLTLLAVWASSDADYEKAREELESLLHVDWDTYNVERVWPTIENALDEPPRDAPETDPATRASIGNVIDALDRFNDGIDHELERLGAKRDPRDKRSDLVDYSSFAPQASQTLAELLYALDWPAVQPYYPDPERSPEGMASFAVGPDPPKGLVVSVKAADKPAHFDGSRYWIEYVFTSGSDGYELPNPRIPHPALGAAEWPVPPVLPWLEQTYGTGATEAATATEPDVRTELLYDGTWLPGVQRFLFDLEADTPRRAKLRLTKLEEASRGKVSVLGVSLPERLAGTFGAALLLAVMSVLWVHLQVAVRACARAGVSVGEVPFSLFAEGWPARALILCTVVALPLATFAGLLDLGGCSWTWWTPLQALCGLGLVAVTSRIYVLLAAARRPEKEPLTPA